MNCLTVPPSPNWYENSIMTCAPDRTLIYGARTDIIIMKNPSYKTAHPASVDVIPNAHSQRVTSVAINTEWGEPNKYLVSTAEDKMVKCWDVSTKTIKDHHNGHLTHGKLIGAVFLNEEKVISVSEDGTAFVWNIILNQTVLLSEISFKFDVTCLKACPHLSWLVAFGLKNGLVVVADVRKKGNILFRLRGHEKAVISLAWCPVPINIFPRDPKNYIGGQRARQTIADDTPAAVDDGSCKMGMGGDVAIQPDIIVTDPKFNVWSADAEPIASTSADSKQVDTNVSDVKVTQDGDVMQDAPNIDLEQQEEQVADVNVEDVVPASYIPEEEAPRKEYLLASSAKESNIYIWRAGTDGRMQIFLTLPSKKGLRRSKMVEKMWITLCWPMPKKLLSSSRFNELLQWTLPKAADDTKPVSVVHHDHNALLFCIAAPLQIFNETNWSTYSKKGFYAWTVAQDRWLLNTSLSADKRNLASYPTFGSSIECMDVGSGDPYRIAIGTADGFIKVWDCSKPHIRQITMSIFYQKIQSKVVALAWHPEMEYHVAFGTQEGRIGYFDTSSKHKMPVILPQYFNTEIHKLQYAPYLKTGTFTLYAMAEGNLIVFEPTSNKIVKIETPRSDYPYTFSWRPDFSCFLLNTRAGALLTYNKELVVTNISYINHKIPQMLWHPHSVNKTDLKEHSLWVACILDFKQVVVFDMAIETRIAEEKIVARYDGQGDIITDIRWNNFNEHVMAIASENGIIQVWDVVTGHTLATVVNPRHEAVQAIQYSCIDSSYIIAGGKDNMLRIWDITECPPYDEQQLATKRNLASKKKVIEHDKELRDDIHLSSKDEKGKLKSKTKTTLIPKFYTAKNTSDMLKDLRRLLEWKINDQKIEKEPHDNRDVDILEIFGSHEDMIKIVSLNESSHLLKGKYSMSTLLTLFKGDVSDIIKDAIDQKRVTQSTIALAPMASPRLWQMACETYADQLSETGGADPLEIATYYLACHEVKKAINALCDGCLFREAFALVKCRFGETNDVVLDVVEKWAKYARRTGNFELAAQCYIFLGQLEEAATTLSKRTDPGLVLFAAELAEEAGNVELHQYIHFRYETLLSSKEEEKPEPDKHAPPLHVVLAQEIEKLEVQEKANKQEKEKAEHQEEKVQLQEKVKQPEKEEAEHQEVEKELQEKAKIKQPDKEEAEHSEEEKDNVEQPEKEKAEHQEDEKELEEKAKIKQPDKEEAEHSEEEKDNVEQPEKEEAEHQEKQKEQLPRCSKNLKDLADPTECTPLE